MRIHHTDHGVGPAFVGADRAVLDLPDGRQLLLERRERRATFSGPPLTHDELVHPYLGAAVSVFSRWAGDEVFHAGAFMLGGRAWGVVGTREAGKSTLLAALEGRGLPVLADDLVVTDGHQAFIGPRTIDLREPRPGLSGPMKPARSASRWRIGLPPAPRAVPLGGWIYLRWGLDVAMPSVSASTSLARLAVRRTWPTLGSDPQMLLALATRPAWDFERPVDWAQMDAGLDLILDTVGAWVSDHRPFVPSAGLLLEPRGLYSSSLLRT